MTDRHDLRKLRLLQREVEDAVKVVLANPEKFDLQPFGESQVLVDSKTLAGILAFFAGRWDGAKK